jgi:hypothetical protein
MVFSTAQFLSRMTCIEKREQGGKVSLPPYSMNAAM